MDLLQHTKMISLKVLVFFSLASGQLCWDPHQMFWCLAVKDVLITPDISMSVLIKKGPNFSKTQISSTTPHIGGTSSASELLLFIRPWLVGNLIIIRQVHKIIQNKIIGNAQY